MEKKLGLSVEIVHRTPKPTPEKVARIWAEEWAKEGWQIDWQRLLPRRGFEVLPRRWVVEGRRRCSVDRASVSRLLGVALPAQISEGFKRL